MCVCVLLGKNLNIRNRLCLTGSYFPAKDCVTMNIMVSVGKISHAIANLTYMGQGKGKLNLVGTTVTR